jgi:magnesium chelatase family protein
MEISAAGAHNMMMGGPPGSGKTLDRQNHALDTAKSYPLKRLLEITKIYSVAGLLPNRTALIKSRPFRSPHHTASGVALVGGGAWPKPGEISLGASGCFFLDEFPEFPRQVLENLRQPLEDGIIHVSRAAGNLLFPAKFILISAMNPLSLRLIPIRKKIAPVPLPQISNYKKKFPDPLWIGSIFTLKCPG